MSRRQQDLGDVAERAEAARLDIEELERATDEGMPETQPPTWRVAVVGSPTFTDAGVMRTAIERTAPRRIVTGSAPGAEALARSIASDAGIPVEDAPRGPAESLLQRVDAVLVFLGPGAPTADVDGLMRQADRMGLTVTVFHAGPSGRGRAEAKER